MGCFYKLKKKKLSHFRYETCISQKKEMRLVG